MHCPTDDAGLLLMNIDGGAPLALETRNATKYLPLFVGACKHELIAVVGAGRHELRAVVGSGRRHNAALHRSAGRGGGKLRQDLCLGWNLEPR